MRASSHLAPTSIPSARPALALRCRRALAGSDPAGWGKVTVTNTCPYTVAVKAGFVHDTELDKGHACPGAVADADVKTLSNCVTDWVFVR